MPKTARTRDPKEPPEPSAEDTAEAQKQPSPPPPDDAGLPRRWLLMGFAVGFLLAVGHIYLALFPELSELERNAFHFGGFAFLCALYFPFSKRAREKAPAFWRWADLALGLVAVAAAFHVATAESAIYDRGVRLTALDWTAGVALILCAIELTRRATGWVIPILIVASLSYVGWWGQFVEGVFQFKGLTWETVLFRSLYGDFALFGTIASISSTYVFLFIIFGAFLVRSGAGEYIIDLSRAAAGRLVGGPGLVAVIASGLTGTISGSAVANTASTGVITIPMMKRAGFPARFAGAVEASSSTGGQLMPPIMGAGAFVMASYTQLPYEQIIAVAALPALLYFASVGFFVRIEARRQGLQPQVYEGPGLWQTTKERGASFIIPIIVLIVLLVNGFTPTYAAAIGIATVIAASWLTRTPMGPKAIVEALAHGARNMVMTAVLLCAVGLVINVIVTAGVGNTFSLMIADWAGGNLLIAIALIALASLVLGMGLPVTAAYIVLATLSAPALRDMIADSTVIDMIAGGQLGAQAQAIMMISAPDAAAKLAAPMPVAEAKALLMNLPMEIRAALRDLVVDPAVMTAALLSAHMIIFWLSQDSNVTPPVCLAAFTAAAIGNSDPMRTGLTSWKIAKGLYIVPVLFAYTPLLSGDWGAAVEVFLFALVGIYGMAAGMDGWMEARLPLLLRPVSFAAGVACVWPANLLVDVAGVAVVFSLFAWTVWKSRQGPAAPAASRAAG
ncbi:TRAP transporter permease [Caenispirillum salinarum]|uniref:TRAP transporter permease n=1 Tax=Caenispirillum salinarum TaxID=859058 RepID=UPI0038516074